MPTDEELITRANAARLKFPRPYGDEPTASATRVETHAGYRYVVYRRGGHIVDAYRYVEQRGTLQRMVGTKWRRDGVAA